MKMNEFRTFDGEKYQLLFKKAVGKVYLRDVRKFVRDLKVRMRSIKEVDGYYVYLNYKDMSFEKVGKNEKNRP